MVFNVADHILYEDDFILVVDKPSGLMVEPDRNQNPSLLAYVKQYLQAKTGNTDVYAQHIHRLDRPVRGMVLFTKQREVLRNLSEQFAERTVKKFYQALTDNAPAQQQARLEHWHRKEKKKAVLYDYEIAYSEKAILDYSITPTVDDKFLWHITLHTGKYHQVRAQLARVGCPILGDEVYGSTTPYMPGSIALWAHRLVFRHPATGKELDLEKPGFYTFFTI